MDDYDTTSPPTHPESTVSTETIKNPNIQADEKRAYNVAYLLVYF